MRILVTRPEREGERLAARLTAAGHNVLMEPLMRLTFLDREMPSLQSIQALLFTSANGVAAFARLTAERDRPVYAVGEATARAARQAGFLHVSAAGGDVASLAARVSAALMPQSGALLHVAGSTIAGDLSGLLQGKGFELRREIFYHMEASGQLSDRACHALMRREIDLILFFSPRTARIFSSLSQKQGIEDYLDTIVAGCLSPAVSDALHSAFWRRIVVAKQASERALMDATGLGMVE